MMQFFGRSVVLLPLLCLWICSASVDEIVRKEREEIIAIPESAFVPIKISNLFSSSAPESIQEVRSAMTDTRIQRRSTEIALSARDYRETKDKREENGMLATILNRHSVVRMLGRLRRAFRDILESLIVPGEPVALVSLPKHWNLGDSFIWLGEKIVLDSLGINPVWACFVGNCSNIGELKEVIKKGTILVTGGGNYGDLWRESNNLLTKLVNEFPQNRIVQLPQSIFYTNDDRAVSDLNIHFSHKQFYLLLRDAESRDYVSRIVSTPPLSLDPYIQSTWSSRTIMCPDAAVGVGPVLPNCEPTVDVVFLSRFDKEKVINETSLLLRLESVNITVKKVDWSDWRDVFSRKRFQSTPKTMWELPSFRLNAANNMLCQARVVLSDRLHACVLSLLMGKPFVGLDNSYKKLTNVRKLLLTWQDASGPVWSEHGRPLSADVLKNYMVLKEGEAVDVIQQLLGR